MEYTTSSGALAMPAHYALVPQEEMVYLDGGALFNITQEQVIQFGVTGLLGGLYGLSMASYYYMQLVDPLIKAFQDAFAAPAGAAPAEALPAAA